MPESKSTLAEAGDATEEIRGIIERIAQEGAQKFLQAALEAEVEEHLARYEHLRDRDGRRAVVNNGHAPERTILTGVGPVVVRRPRVDERGVNGKDGHQPFTSAILPRFLRRTPTLEGALTTLYLKGVSTNDFSTALAAILGEKAAGLSAATISRLKRDWEKEYEQWRKRPLGSTEYAYLWADGVYFNVRLEDERSCILVVIGGNYKGEKELLGVRDGFRESEQSWKELLLELKGRGLEIDPKLAIADGALGFWKALPQVYPSTRTQRCWVHKTANVLDKLPSSMQGRAKAMIHDIYRAESAASARKAYAHFQAALQDKYPEAVECLRKDEESLFTFYDFPAAHWLHIRSTNVIESVFATVRLRTNKTKGCGTRLATLTMVFKLIQEAQRTWRKLDGSKHLEFVHAGRRFVDGVLQEEAAA
ncbi:MAG: IS256 family transposase [Spirochaetia bacterium]|jgi:transposase-like protein